MAGNSIILRIGLESEGRCISELLSIFVWRYRYWNELLYVELVRDHRKLG